MNEDNFNKGINELNEISLTAEEKSRILQAVLDTPVESPFVAPSFSFLHLHAFRAAFAICLIALVSFGGLGYASNESLPGDTLYGMKVSVLEPALDVVNATPEARVEWAAAKVERRILEAELLAEKDLLDDEKSQELELQVEKNSRAFVKVVDEVNGGNADKRKEEFRKKFAVEEDFSAAGTLMMATAPSDFEQEVENEMEIEDSSRTLQMNAKMNVSAKSGSKEKIEKLKRKAIEALDDESSKGKGKVESEENN